MDVRPKYSAVGAIFPENRIYNVPAFQRSYSWGKSNVEQFLNDIKEIYDATNSGEETLDHFMGGIVCVKVDNDDRFDEKSVFELVDGQQRLSTTVLLVSRIIDHMNGLSLSGEDSELRNRRIKKYRNKFLEVIIEEDDKEVSLPRMNMTRRDSEYYYNAVYNNSFSSPKIKSHELIQGAARIIDTWLTKNSSTKTPEEILSDMNVLFNVISKAFSIIIIKMVDVSDAYRLFQVINDRGRSLTSGDLLRAGSLGQVDASGANGATLERLEEVWDLISAGGNKNSDDRLLAYFNAKTGKVCRKTALFQNFNEKFFANNTDVVSTIDDIGTFSKQYDSLSKGEWPYTTSQLSDYQKNKLLNLVVKFKHTKCLPFLMAATQLEEKKFYQMIFCLEKFFFIFRVVLGKRMNAVTKLYNDTINQINDSPENFQSSRFVGKVIDIVNNSITPSEIITYVESLDYQVETNRRAIKFILVSLEENNQWLNSENTSYKQMYRHAFKGLDANPGLFSLEHIYPKKPKVGESFDDLEPVKHKLGNLTLLYAQDNSEFGNDKFLDKKSEYDKSRLNVTKGLSILDKWEWSEYNDRDSELKSFIVKLFSFGVLSY